MTIYVVLTAGVIGKII